MKSRKKNKGKAPKLARAKRPHVKLPAPVRTVNTSGSIWLSSHELKPTQVPDLPSYYPNDLKSQTRLILLEAVRNFPDQTKMLEMCKYIFPELTAHVRTAVQRGRLRADLAHSDMEALLHSVLVSNDAYRLVQEVKKSDEWLALARAIPEADLFRTDENQATASHAQNSDKTAHSVESRSWPEIEIAFLSDERVEICSGVDRKTCNYTELGFEDRRNGKPNRAWEMLREMSSSGTIPRPSPGKDKAKIQKPIEQIRKKLRSHFGIQTDPIPFNGNTYQASFKISRRSSFET